MREERDLYNKNLELTGKTYFKGDSIPADYYPMVVMIAIQNANGEFLMQKRVESKGGDYGVIEFERGCDGKDCYIMYYTQMELDVDKLDIQLDELTEVKWFSMRRLEEMVKSKELNQDQIDFFNKFSISQLAPIVLG